MVYIAPRRPTIVARPGVRGFAPRRTRPAPTRLGYALLVVIVLLVAGVGVGLARAEEEEIPRYQPASRGTRPAVAQWEPLLAAYPWDVATALRVLDCESGGDPEAVNPWSGAAGLFQAMPSWRGLARRLFGSGDLFDPVVNTALAFVLWEDSGGRFSWHWQASIGCWSRR